MNEQTIGSHQTMPRDEAEKSCLCKGCPSYFNCGEKIAYCVDEGGKSNCIKNKAGCVCPGCPVQVKLNYTDVYYCIDGSEKEIIINKK